jgi:hypothetical protein
LTLPPYCRLRLQSMVADLVGTFKRIDPAFYADIGRKLCHHRAMEPRTPLDDIKAAAAAYKRAKAAYEKAQAVLADAVVAGLRAGERPADVSRASEWDREYNRRLKKKADERDAAGG